MSTELLPRADDPHPDDQTILLVDDDINNLTILAEYLRGHSFAITVARSGEKALEQVRLASPDLILLEVVLPGIDGFEICRRLKAHPATHDIPVIFVTTLSNPADTLAGF